jgi:DNA polymerase III subunit delta
MDALAFLDKASKSKRQPLYVLHGDEDFLKRRVLATLVPTLVGATGSDFGVSTYSGERAEFSAVRNELNTLPFLSERRVVVIEQADPFVTRHRAALEKYAAEPSAAGVLILGVKNWPANTKLAKAVSDSATIQCKAPAAYRLPDWCMKWAATQYGKQLSKVAAELLVELVGAEMGVLDQELQKLAGAIGQRDTIEQNDVDELVGRSRSANVFRIMDAVGEGKPAEALAILQELFEEGEEPLAILGALGAQLRRLAQAARLFRDGMGIDDAMDEAGVAKWPQARDSARRQMKHLGAARLDRLFDWLLEVDQGLKGGSMLPERMQLERLIVRLARPRVDKAG